MCILVDQAAEDRTPVNRSGSAINDVRWRIRRALAERAVRPVLL
jgi:hypothetical protein